MAITDRHQKKQSIIKEYRLEDIETLQMFKNITHDKLEGGFLEALKNEVINQKITQKEKNISGFNIDSEDFKPSFQ